MNAPADASPAFDGLDLWTVTVSDGIAETRTWRLLLTAHQVAAIQTLAALSSSSHEATSGPHVKLPTRARQETTR